MRNKCCARRKIRKARIYTVPERVLPERPHASCFRSMSTKQKMAKEKRDQCSNNDKNTRSKREIDEVRYDAQRENKRKNDKRKPKQRDKIEGIPSQEEPARSISRDRADCLIADHRATRYKFSHSVGSDVPRVSR